jgi:predicted membrane chloride channel (bestrophin family)
LNREEGRPGWKDVRIPEIEHDLLPESLLKHISEQEAKDLQAQGYALVSHWMYILVEELAQKRILGYMHSKSMFQNLETLHLASMAVEKIHNTPMPDLMRMGTAISVYFYCYLCFPLVLCLQVQGDLDKWPAGFARLMAIVILVIIYFVVVQLIMILFVLGIHFEDPYGDDAYDLPLIPMVKNVDRDINSVFFRGLNRSIPRALLPQLSDEGKAKAAAEAKEAGQGSEGLLDEYSDEEMD